MTDATQTVSPLPPSWDRGVFAPLCVVGLGPGHAGLLAPDAAAALKMARVIVGYSGYIKSLPREFLEGREIVSTGMMGEIARVNAAIESSLNGKSTALVCSGDPGIYALAGLTLELLEKRAFCATDLPLRVVPGIPAVCAAAALLGAPLTHDFACISLSDLLTPWPLIRKRLNCAFSGDFVVALYNPRSQKRPQQLRESLDIALQYRSPHTPVGIARNAFRPEQKVRIDPLNKIRPDHIDMFTLLVIGNSHSRIIPGRGATPLAWENGARMVTPRGYAQKYEG